MSSSNNTCIYGIVPPHLLRAIADNHTNDPEHRQTAERSLSLRSTATVRRVEHIRSLTQPRGYTTQSSAGPRPRTIVPEHLFQAIIDAPDTTAEAKACAQRDLEHLRTVHGQRLDQSDGHGAQHSMVSQSDTSAQQQPTEPPPAQKGDSPQHTFYRAVYDAGHTEDYAHLPGKQVRIESQPASGDKSIDDAFDNCGLVLQFFKEKFNWNSIDNKGMHVVSSCHFGKKYENAFWDPDMMQMVYGDGGDFLHNFAECRDVIGHEMTHAITEHTSPLDYEGQSGALNEHISDVFGIMVKQMAEQETAEKADWLIGEGCLLPGVKGVALRSMKAPGTAYNDKRFGKDPQPANMKDFKPMREDNGGVHVYSGIPNKAFYLTAVAFGGFSWEKAGQIWWKTMTSGRIPPRCTFLQFADTTTDVAEELYGDAGATIVRKAWNDVGVVRKSFA